MNYDDELSKTTAEARKSGWKAKDTNKWAILAHAALGRCGFTSGKAARIAADRYCVYGPNKR